MVLIANPMLRGHWAPLILLSLAGFSIGALYESVDSLPVTNYDFIIAGGGTAGNVIANRLSENPEWRVLVIEKGPSSVNNGVLDSIVPYIAGSLMGSSYDWNYTTTPQNALNDRVLWYARGHILGGSSSINNMYYTRGPSSDFDRYANETGDAGWSWNNLQPYIRKNEVWTAPADNHNTNGQFNPSAHGFSGTVSVSLAGHPQGGDSSIIKTTQQLSDEFPFNEDMNSGNPLGLGWIQSTIKGGERSSSATAYLAQDILDRPNLDVVVGTQITRVLQTGTADGRPAFGAVEVAQNTASAALKRLVASKEVILSAGVIGTPHILLSSGIGDAVELRAVGVEPVLDLSDVGKNFSDHPAVWNSWHVDLEDTFDDMQRDPALRAQYQQQWDVSKTGPLVLTTATHLIFGRLPSDLPIFQKVTDPSSGSNAPHYELFTVNSAFPVPPSEGNYISVVSLVASPASQCPLNVPTGGTITLKSSDPFEYPLIDPGALTSEFDRLALREAYKASLRFMSAPVWKDHIVGPAAGLANVTSDEDLDNYILQTSVLGLHGVGTAAMSAKNAPYGVVDPDLLVKGASGLRIVDASVFPYIPAAHTQAPVYIIAERAADLIKASWSTESNTQFDSWYEKAFGNFTWTGFLEQTYNNA
ncbi:hypothetical protein DXG01_001176 [Tephrocybe rancida]|nr:hypothetical protein DXG01_001176 [Tephrocybe rancida]